MICGYVDERCAPPDPNDGNYSRAGEALLYQVRKPLARVHRMRGEASASLQGLWGLIDLVAVATLTTTPGAPLCALVSAVERF